MKLSQEHAKTWGPFYALFVLLGGGGSLAAFTDNLPVTRAELEAHTGSTHTQTATELATLESQLKRLHLGQLQAQMRQAYSDRCVAKGAALRYIVREISRLRTEYFASAGREYDPPPCIDT